MLGLVVFARSNTNSETGAVYSNVHYLPLTAAGKDRKDEAGLRPIELRSDVEPCLQIREVLWQKGPVVCELEVVPEIFGRSQSLRLTAVKVMATCDRVRLTVNGIEQMK